jgi:hypothetical protein
MHWLVIGSALVLAAIWLLVLTLHVAEDLLRALLAEMRSEDIPRSGKRSA